MIKRQYRFITLPSTNTWASHLARTCSAHGTIIRAESQTAGRGRLGKVWLSPSEKGLYFSIIVRPRLTSEEYPKLSMTVGLAVAKAIEKTCDVDVFLKWPNDIYLNGKKCGGILCESGLSPGKNRFGIVGIGLNVLTAKSELPKDIRESATSIAMATGIRLDLESMFIAVVEAVLAEIHIHEDQGFSSILREWQHRDFLHGKRLNWLNNSGEIIEGISEGPDEHGRLMVRDLHNVLHEVISGDITLAKKK